MPTHTFRFGLGDPTTIHLSGEITIRSPDGIPYTQVYDALAEEAATAFKEAMRSRLNPPPKDLHILSETAKNLRAIHGEKYARAWLEGGLDPMRFKVTDRLEIVLTETQATAPIQPAPL